MQDLKAHPTRADVHRGLMIHAMMFVCVMAGLFWLDASRGGASWVQWPLVGWGAGLGLHALLAWRYKPERPNVAGRFYGRRRGKGTEKKPSPVAWWRRRERTNRDRGSPPS